MAEVVIPYTPRLWAEKLHNSFKRYFSLIIHRRGGKTTALINHLQRAATDDNWEEQRMRALVPGIKEEDLKTLIRNRFYGLVFPLYSQAKTTAWDMMKYYALPIPGVKFNEAELTVRYPNGSKCRLFGADNPDALRGPAFWGLGFDEYSQQPPNIFGEVLSKGLADHLGFAIFAGTIKGKNQLYRTNTVARQNPNEWDYVWQDIDYTLAHEQGITVETLRQALEDDKKLVAQGMMSQEEFDQEWYLSTEAAVKGSYYSNQIRDARAEGRIGGIYYEPGLKVSTAWDIGIGDATAIWFFQRVGIEIRLIDYYETTGEGLPYFVKILNDKAFTYSDHFGPHDLKNREVGTGKTRLEVAQKLGINFKIVPKLPIEEGIDAVRRMFNKCRFDDKCAAGMDALIHYHKEWDDKQGQFKEHPFHDWSSHGADAFRYLALGRSEGEVNAYVEDPEIREFEEIRRKQGEGKGDVLDVFE